MSVYRDMLKKLEEDQGAPQAAPVSAPAPSVLPDFQQDLGNLVRSLERLKSANGIRTVLFTALDPGAGTSTLVHHTAGMLAQVHQKTDQNKVLLIDANYRSTSPPMAAANAVGLDGLPRYVLQEEDLDSCRQTSLLPGVDLLLGRSSEAHWMSRITAERLHSRLELLKERYGWILLDMPSADMPECLSWSGVCDGVVMIVESGRTRRYAAQATVDRLKSHNANLLGCVINKRRQVIPEFIYRWLFK